MEGPLWLGFISLGGLTPPDKTASVLVIKTCHGKGGNLERAWL